MKEKYRKIFEYPCGIIISFIILSLSQLDTERKIFIFLAVINFVSIIFLLTFGRPYYRKIEVFADKNSLEVEHIFPVFLVYIPFINTLYACVLFAYSIKNRVSGLENRISKK